MVKRNTYLTHNEIKVKNLLSEMYNNESNLLAKINKKKEHIQKLRDELSTLEEDYKNQNKLRNDLTQKFEALQESDSSNWDEFKAEYEMILDFAEGDKYSFLEKAEMFMAELNKKIEELEERVKESSSSVKKKTQEMLDELNERKQVLQEKLDDVKADTGEVWKEVRQWFIERANDVKALF